MATKKSQKIEAQVVAAIRRLQAIQGSTPKEISNYIAQEYNIPSTEIRRHVQIALKRGVAYGILQRLKGGCYSYNQDFLSNQCLSAGDGSEQIPCKRSRRSHSHRRSYKRRRRGGRSRRRRSRRRRSRRRGSRRRRSSKRRRKRGRRRRREELPKDIDRIEVNNITKQTSPSKSNTLLEQESPQSDHSTISGNTEEKQE